MADLDLMLLRRRADNLISAAGGPGGPGMTLGLVRDGELVLHRQAGLASLELGVPIGPDTTFRIASVSKQFTCAAVLLLAAEGTLELQDEARTHLPELPDFGPKLTIAHLMHNTSGIRDMLEIMRLGGVDLSMPVTRDNLLTGITRQRTLNFAPGTRYLYSNSNFLLLGLIVERVSGMSLSDFLAERIFTPLGMDRTRMVESTIEVVPGLAAGYLPKDGGWMRAAHGFPLGGEGGLVSSVEDLALWARNFETGRVGGEGLIEALERQTPFANGRTANYARGLSVRHYRGIRAVDHGGLWPGYKTEFLRAPELRLAVICITNNGGADPYHTAHDLLDAAIEGRPGVHAVPKLPPIATLQSIAGRYLDRERGVTLDFSVNPDGLLIGNANGVPFRLKQGDDGRLVASRSAGDFAMTAEGDELAVELDAGFAARYRRVTGPASLPNDLGGSYRNEEIGATWTIRRVADGTLALDVTGPIIRDRAWEIEPIEGDVVRFYPPSTLFRSWVDAQVLREAGAITGLQVNGGRAKGLVFARQGVGK